jgi:tRNA-splicing ligase RtcB
MAKKKCEAIRLNLTIVLRCIGTLGSGNHFIEVDENNDNYYLVVHSGSRLFGKYIYEYWAGRMKDAGKDSDKNVCKDASKDDDENIPFDGSYVLSGIDSYEYFADMIFAQQFACMNRIAIISSVLCELEIEFDGSKMISSVHNYIDFNDLILRKGAVRAHKGEKCIVALNMRDGIIIGTGIGDEEWNYSAPHGAGRVLSRKSAMKVLTNKDSKKFAMKNFELEMDGIISNSIVPEVLDERPSAYRNSNIIIESMQRNVQDIIQYKTRVVAKGF